MGFLRDKRNSSSSATTTSPCADLRAAYHNCFNRWYSEKFLKGHWDKEECVSEWQKYRDCLSADAKSEVVYLETWEFIVDYLNAEGKKHLDDKNLSRFLEAEGLKRIPASISK